MKKKPGTDPTKGKHDPRFAPASDEASAKAHARDQRKAGPRGRTVIAAEERIGPGDNPTSPKDARFTPTDDDESKAAHDEGSGGPDEPEASDEVQAIVKRMIEEAVQHYQDELEPEQTKATDYYKGRPFGDEKDGRSKVVSTDVRDATLAQIPSIMRVLYGPDQTVEFKPRGPEDEQVAREMTDGVRYIVTEENNGFLVLHDFVQDGLVRKLGVTKAWFEESYRVTADSFSGLSEDQVAQLEEDPDCEVEIESRAEDGTLNVHVTRRKKGGCTKIAAVPSEEFVYTPDARDLDAAPLVAHVREMPSDELIAMGIDPELVKKHVGKTRGLDSDGMESTRNFYDGSSKWKDSDDDRDASQRTVLYAEAYVLIDLDGDEIAERRLFQCVGPDYEIANGPDGEIVDDVVPFAVWCPYREAHTIVGDSNYDLLATVQRVKSHVLRKMLDSFSLATDPKTEVVQGQVNMGDLLNDEIGGIVRVRAPGMIREVGNTFVGEAALPVLGYFDGIKEDRTGTSKAAMGLDADALQSSTKAAVAATLSGSQQRIEFIVRMLAETGLKRLFRLVAALEAKHQNAPRYMRLRNQWVPIDPRYWDSSMDVQVNVALGQGTPQDKIEALAAILASQKELMGMGAPFVGWAEIRNAINRVIEQAGYKDSTEFFQPWGPEQDQAMQQAKQNQEPPPDPTMMLAQIEQSKVQLQAMDAERTASLNEWKAMQENDREREKAAADIELRRYEINLKYGAQITQMQLEADVKREKHAMEAESAATPTTEAA